MAETKPAPKTGVKVVDNFSGESRIVPREQLGDLLSQSDRGRQKYRSDQEWLPAKVRDASGKIIDKRVSSGEFYNMRQTGQDAELFGNIRAGKESKLSTEQRRGRVVDEMGAQTDPLSAAVIKFGEVYSWGATTALAKKYLESQGATPEEMELAQHVMSQSQATGEAVGTVAGLGATMVSPLGGPAGIAGSLLFKGAKMGFQAAKGAKTVAGAAKATRAAQKSFNLLNLPTKMGVAAAEAAHATKFVAGASETVGKITQAAAGAGARGVGGFATGAALNTQLNASEIVANNLDWSAEMLTEGAMTAGFLDAAIEIAAPGIVKVAGKVLKGAGKLPLVRGLKRGVENPARIVEESARIAKQLPDATLGDVVKLPGQLDDATRLRNLDEPGLARRGIGRIRKLVSSPSEEANAIRAEARLRTANELRPSIIKKAKAEGGTSIGDVTKRLADVAGLSDEPIDGFRIVENYEKIRRGAQAAERVYEGYANAAVKVENSLQAGPVASKLALRGSPEMAKDLSADLWQAFRDGGLDNAQENIVKNLSSRVKGKTSTKALKEVLTVRNNAKLAIMRGEDITGNMALADTLDNVLLGAQKHMKADSPQLVLLTQKSDELLDLLDSVRKRDKFDVDALNLDKYKVDAKTAGRIETLTRELSDLGGLKATTATAYTKQTATAADLLAKNADNLEEVLHMNTVRNNALIASELPLGKLPGSPSESMYQLHGAVAKQLEHLEGMVRNAPLKTMPWSKSTAAGRAGVWVFRGANRDGKVNSYKEVKDYVTKFNTDQQFAMNQISDRTQRSGEMNSELAEAQGANQVLAIQYLNRVMPLNELEALSPDARPSMTEIDAFLEQVGAIADPSTVMESALGGSVSAEAIQAVRTVYPQRFAEMQSILLREMQGLNLDEMAYGVKHSIDQFLGGGLDVSGDPMFWARLNDSSAQTVMQEAQQRPQGQLGSKNPAVLRATQTEAGKLEAL